MNARLAIGLAATLIAGCAVGPNYHRPQIALPEHYAAQPQTDGAVNDLASWWHALQDPELDSLLDRAITANPDVEIALDHLQAARTYEAGMLGEVLPDLEGSAAAARGTGSDLARGRAPQSLVSADDSSTLRHINEIGGFDSVWELDVFGKYRREMQAARADTQALAAARDGALVSIIADVARAYIDMRGAQMRVATLQATIQTLQESQRITHIRYQRGITNELDVTLADRELADTQAQLPPLQAQASAGQYTLATLLGQFPEDLVTELTSPGMIPATPKLAPAGLPPELLRQRPDIRQAERELAASSARIGVATAALFPDVAVTAAIGFQRQGLGTDPAIGQHIWSAGPAVLWPLLDFGTLDAQVDIADLRTRALLVGYRKAIQSARRGGHCSESVHRRAIASGAAGGCRDGEPAGHYAGAGTLRSRPDRLSECRRRAAPGLRNPDRIHRDPNLGGRPIRRVVPQPRRRLAALPAASGYPSSTARNHRRLPPARASELGAV